MLLYRVLGKEMMMHYARRALVAHQTNAKHQRPKPIVGRSLPNPNSYHLGLFNLPPVCPSCLPYPTPICPIALIYLP